MRTRNCFFCLWSPGAVCRAGFSCLVGAFAFLFILSWCAAAASCGLPWSGVLGPKREDPERLSVMSWNLQCFFDSSECGTEYDEYRGGGWTAEKYEARLDRLREVLLFCGREAGDGADRGPDIAVFQEIENEQTLRDLCNRLPRRCGYRTAVFIPPESGGAFGLAVLARFQADRLTVHSVGPSGSPLRPLGELSLTVGNRRLVVFAAHWKSKSGEAEEGEALRRRQEETLAARIDRVSATDPDCRFIACGDFNQGRDDFSLIAASNGWDSYDAVPTGGPDGSYWYRGEWERIDHIWYGSGLRTRSFRPVAAMPFAGEGGVPARYEVWSGRGYSDHLPVLAVFEF